MAENPHPTDLNSRASASGVSKQQLLKSSTIVSMATFGSRILGLIRDVLVARYFGTQADAFFVAFKIPNLFRRFFAEGAFANAFVPVLSEYKTQGPHQIVQHLVQTTLGSLCAVLMPITLIGVLGAPLLVMLFAPGFTQHADKFALTVDLLRFTFPYLWLISLTAFAGAVLNTYQHFAVPAATPMLLNLSMIGFTLGLSASLDEPLMALAWAVLSAGAVQLLIHLPKLQQLKLLGQPRVNFKDPGVRKILRLMAPIVFGASVYQLNMLVDVFIASFLQAGSITWLYFSDRLVQLPLGMIAVALSVVILPNLSSQHAAKDPIGFSQTLDWAIRIICLIGIPATLGLILLAEPILITLFLHGEMTAADIQQMVPSLRAYALGLFAFMMIKVLAPGFFAQQDSTTPIRIGIQAMALSVVLNFPLAYWLDHVGLALSTSLGAIANMGLLYWTLTHKGLYQRASKGWKTGLQIVIANTVMVTVLLLEQAYLPFSANSSLYLQIAYLCFYVISAGLAYGLALMMGFCCNYLQKSKKHLSS